MIKGLQQQHRVVRVVTKFLLPPILLFAFYVQFHGDFGPGGGFQAGVIFAAAFILHGLIFGEAQTRLILSPYRLRLIMSLGLLLYAGVGLSSLFLGGEYLNYSVLASDSVTGQHWGILLVELGVGMTVSAVMISLFYCFSSKRNTNNETIHSEQVK
ncbi:MAG: Na(+)/H(+) antiporter subunit B [Pseudomonadota bacterium]